MQIEYLVVCYDDQNKRVRLSLRQADILQALAEDEKLLNQGGGVPDVQPGVDKLEVPRSIVIEVNTDEPQVNPAPLESVHRRFTPSLVDSCWRLPLANHGA